MNISEQITSVGLKNPRLYCKKQRERESNRQKKGDKDGAKKYREILEGKSSSQEKTPKTQ
jgi:hypothetical protein